MAPHSPGSDQIDTLLWIGFVAAAIIVSGALHEDGLADVADALGAHTTTERRLEILKDPRVGTFGALALVLAVGLATTTSAGLRTADAAKALIQYLASPAAASVVTRMELAPIEKR